MIVQLTGSAQNLEVDLAFLQKIAEVVHNHNGVLAHDWIGVAQKRVIKNKRRDDDKADWRDYFKHNCDAINRSDITIIEASTYGFMQGYYAAYAARNKKPTLIVLRQKDIRKRPIYGIDDAYITLKEYETIEQLEKIVDSFVKATAPLTKHINLKLPLSRTAYDFIDKLSNESGRQREQIINDILERESLHDYRLD